MLKVLPSRYGLRHIRTDKSVVGKSGVCPLVLWSQVPILVGGDSQIMHQLPQRANYRGEKNQPVTQTHQYWTWMIDS